MNRWDQEFVCSEVNIAVEAEVLEVGRMTKSLTLPEN